MKLLFCSLLLLACAFAQQRQGPLTNQGVGGLVVAGVPEGEVIRVIATAPRVDFDLRPASTDALLKVGVSEEVIKAMAGRESGTSVPVSARNAPRTYPSPAISHTPEVAANIPASPRTVLTGSNGLLYQGTPIRMRIMETVSSADAQAGNNVDFQTLDDIVNAGVVVIPRGSVAIGTITVAESKKRMARGGKLGMNIDYVRLPSGEQLALGGIQNLKGGGHVGAMTGAMVATSIVFWPAAPFFLFMHGKDVTIPEGHEVTVYTNTDYRY